ncbi:MAG: hypothetical protein KA260_10820 [Burkholderiales bacterium]|nr:hypothetical protein [Burkholderiales bacterium]
MKALLFIFLSATSFVSFAQNGARIGIGPVQLNARLADIQASLTDRVESDLRNNKCECRREGHCLYHVKSNRFDEFSFVSYKGRVLHVSARLPIKSVEEGQRILKAEFPKPIEVKSVSPTDFFAYWSHPEYDARSDKLEPTSKYFSSAYTGKSGLITKSLYLNFSFSDQERSIDSVFKSQTACQ